MNEQMSLSDYKKKVEEWMINESNCSIQETNRLMKLYADDFPEFLADNWEPSAAGTAMQMGY